MEPNQLQPQPTRTIYQSPTITQLGGVEQVTRGTFYPGLGDTLYHIADQNGNPVGPPLGGSP